MALNQIELLKLKISIYDLLVSSENTNCLSMSALDSIKGCINCDYIDIFITEPGLDNYSNKSIVSSLQYSTIAGEEVNANQNKIVLKKDLPNSVIKSEYEIFLTSKNISTYILIPLVNESMIFAKLVIASSRVDYFSETLIQNLIEISESLSRALSHNIFHNKLQMQTERLAIIREIEHNIINELSSQRIATTAVSKIRSYLSCEQSSIFLFDFFTQAALLVANDSTFPLIISNGDSIPLGDYIVSEDIYQHKPQIQVNLEHRQIKTKVENYLFNNGIRSYISVPLVAYQQLLGVINLSSSEPYFFTPDIVETAIDISTSIAIALHQSKLREQIQNQNENLESTIIERTKQLTELNKQLFDNKKAMQHIADNVPGAVFRYSIESDMSYNIDFISKGCIDIFGLCSTEMIGKGLEVLNILQEDKDAFFDSLLFSYSKLNQWSYQFRISLTGNIIKWIRVLAQPLQTNENTVTWTGTFTDISDLINSQEEIIRLNTELKDNIVRLEAANKELEAFSYSVSHDLRSPLRSMNGFSEVLLEEYYDKLDNTAKDYLSRIQIASNKMAKLIDDLLQLSRLTRTDLQKTSVDLIPLAKEILNEFSKQYENQIIRYNMQDKIEVNADRALLKILLNNLLSNARKFSSKKEISIINIATEIIDNKSYICVQDNGAGFDMNYKNKIFGAFQRLHSDKDFEGTGIGLAIVQRIVNKHGGEIFVESEIDKGTKIFFNLG